MTVKPYDYCIVGAGIIGFTIAYKLNNRHPDASILLIDKETGRNSGVYYTPSRLKATLCKRGLPALVDFRSQHQVGYEQCGKLIVAVNDDEAGRLQGLYERGRHSNNKVSSAKLQETEPNITGVSAVFSPTTGIVDYVGVCKTLVNLLKARGVGFQFSTSVLNLIENSDEIIIDTDQGTIKAKQLIVCGGLQSDRLADMMGLADDFRILPFRGEYFRLTEKHNTIVKHLIYPVPKPGLPFLGVHLTKIVGGYTICRQDLYLHLSSSKILAVCKIKNFIVSFRTVKKRLGTFVIHITIPATHLSLVFDKAHVKKCSTQTG